MKLRIMSLITLLGSLAAGPVLAADPGQVVENHLDRRGDRIEQRLDNRGDRLNNRLDHRADIAAANGHEKRAKHLDRKGNRIDNRLNRKGHRIDRHLDRRGERRHNRYRRHH